MVLSFKSYLCINYNIVFYNTIVLQLYMSLLFIQKVCYTATSYPLIYFKLMYISSSLFCLRVYIVFHISGGLLLFDFNISTLQFVYISYVLYILNNIDVHAPYLIWQERTSLVAKYFRLNLIIRAIYKY